MGMRAFVAKIARRSLESIANMIGGGSPLLQGYRKEAIKDSVGFIVSSENPAIGMAAERRNATVAAISRVIGDAVKSMPMQSEARTLNADGEEAWTPDDSDAISEMLSYPNIEAPQFTESNLKEHCAQSLLASGNAYLWPEPFQDRFNLWPLSPDKMVIKVTDDAKQKIIGYRYNYSHTKYQDFKPEEILHIRLYNVSSPGGYGLSRNESVRAELETDKAIKDNNLAWFDNNGMPSGIVFADDPSIKPADKEKLREQWDTEFKGKKKNNKLAMVWFKGTFAKTQETPSDLAFETGLNINQENIAGVHGVPPFAIGVLRYANYANTVEQNRILYTGAVIPMTDTIAEAFTVFFFTSKGDVDRRISFDKSQVSALKANELEQARTNAIYTQSGIKTVNEVRNSLGLEDVEWGDEPPASLTAVPIDPPQAGDVSPTKALKSFHRKSFQRMNADEKLLFMRSYDKQLRKWETAYAVVMSKFMAGQKRRVLKALDDVTATGKVMSKLWFCVRDEADDDATKIFNRQYENDAIVESTNPTREKILRVAGQSAINEVDVDATFSLERPEILKAFSKYVSRMEAVNGKTHKALSEIIRSALSADKNINEIKKDIRDLYQEWQSWRVERIARTEIGSAVNTGIVDGYRQGGVEKIEWSATEDEATRETHQELNGKVIGVNEMFVTSTGVQLRHPSDPDGPPEEIINCRCRTIAVIEEGGA